MNCDMCGKETRLFRTIVEGAELNVCESCGGYGKVMGKAKTKEERVQEDREMMELLRRKSLPKVRDIETGEVIVENYSSIIRKKRETMGLTQEEFSRKLNEKESLVHGLENGHHHPSIELARKIERMLNVKLVETVKDDVKVERVGGGAMTIGDLLSQIKKK